MKQNPVCEYLKNYETIELYIHQTARAVQKMCEEERQAVAEGLVMVIENSVPCYVMRNRYYKLYTRLEGRV